MSPEGHQSIPAEADPYKSPLVLKLVEVYKGAKRRHALIEEAEKSGLEGDDALIAADKIDEGRGRAAIDALLGVIKQAEEEETIMAVKHDRDEKGEILKIPVDVAARFGIDLRELESSSNQLAYLMDLGFQIVFNNPDDPHTIYWLSPTAPEAGALKEFLQMRSNHGELRTRMLAAGQRHEPVKVKWGSME